MPLPLTKKELEITLVNRSFLYQLLTRGFSEEPNEKFVAILFDPHVYDEIALKDTPQQEACNAFEKATTAIKHFGVEKAKEEYTRLMIGPGSLPSPPWESAHTTGTRTLFGKQTLAVREFYRDNGFLPARYPAVADDHIALELGFLACMAEKAVAFFEQADGLRCSQALNVSASFLEQHILAWIESFYAELNLVEPDAFLTAWAYFTYLVLKRDGSLLEECRQVALEQS